MSTNTPNIPPELREELLALMRMELDRTERNKTTFRRVADRFENEFKKFDFVEARSGYNSDGKRVTQPSAYVISYKVRDAIGILLRAVYCAKTLAQLPSDRESEMVEFVSDILALMTERKENK